MTKIIGVLGPSGMLGSAVIKAVSYAGHEPRYYKGHRVVDKLDMQAVTKGCDAVINCIGKIPQRCSDNIAMIHSNSIVPHLLAQNFGGRIIHVSTDKVYSGHLPQNVMNAVSDLETPTTIYGKSKLLGEVNQDNVTNVRTSFIGTQHGLLHWLISQEGSVVNGYKNALWSGSYVETVAAGLVGLVDTEHVRGVENLATSWSISKYELLIYLIKERGLHISVQPCDEPYQNFSMKPTKVILSVVNP